MKRQGAFRRVPAQDREPLPTCVNGLDELPAEYERILAEGLAFVGAPEPGREGLAAIGDHVRLLLAWNRAINLTAIRDPEAAAREHVLDSLAAVPLLRSAGIDEFVDLGSGGGFPGVPLAIALPAKRALLVESVVKKARFLETAVACLELAGRVGVAALRAEELATDPRHRGRWQAVVARAVSDTVDLAEVALPLLRPGGVLVAWKRLPVDEEFGREERALGQLRGRLAGVEPVRIPGLEDHVLAVVEKVGETPAEFPRDPAVRRKRPLGGRPVLAGSEAER